MHKKVDQEFEGQIIDFEEAVQYLKHWTLDDWEVDTLY